MRQRWTKFGTAGLSAIALVPAIVLFQTGAMAQSAINLGSRFSPNPMEVRGTGGGSTPAASVAGRGSTPTGACTGFTNTQPDQTLVLSSFFNALSLQVESAEDTALVIKGPGGVWCNDDYDGKNPGVSGQWLAGTYRIWVTSYAKNRTPTYTLRITDSR